MTPQEITTKLDEMKALVAAGQPLEAFEQFYHEDLEKTDLDGITHYGKAANREVGIKLLASVRELRDFTPVGQIVKDNRSFLVWSLDFDHAENGPVKVTEVAVQDWQDGKIIRERYFA